MKDVDQNGKNHSFDKTNPGCLGKMVNLFELNVGVSANRLLTDKSHEHGPPLTRRRADVSRMIPCDGHMEEKVISSEFLNKKSNGTNIKKLIAREMSKEVNSMHGQPNLVAKLMGLDALPRQEPDSAIRNHSGGNPKNLSGSHMSYWEQQNRFSHYVDPNAGRDAYEIWEQPQNPPHKGRCVETINNKKMDLVRQKFIEAKRLSMDQKLRQSKQFQDALEVLSSNKDLLLKCLLEPNSMLYQHHYSQDFVSPPPETKRITVLKPSKVADSNYFAGTRNKKVNQMKKSAFLQLNGLERIHLGSSPPASFESCENPTQPTRIVVLKPYRGNQRSFKTASPPDGQRRMHGKDFFGVVEDNDNQKSREDPEVITQQMHEELGWHHRDETLTSSVSSNGYAGDESSFHESETAYTDGNLYDSEVMSPVSRHSWDYGNRLGSSYSSSFSQASYSPEPSVFQEAKKHLSERRAKMASNGSCQEPNNLLRSSRRLGEMLALSAVKKAEYHRQENCSSEGRKYSNSFVVSELRQDENVDNSPRNLLRSKFVPVSSTKFSTRLNISTSVSDEGKPEIPKDAAKTRGVKSSFTGKVSSLFSRNKKTGKDKSLVSDTKNEFHLFPGEICNDRIESLDKGSNLASPGLQEPSSKASFSSLTGKQDMASPKAGLAAARPMVSGNLGENLDQPSPVSFLDSPSKEDGRTDNMSSHYTRPHQHGFTSPLSSTGSNLINRSQIIESVGHWDDSCVNTASSHLAKETLTVQGTDEEEEEEWILLVQTLLSVAGLHDEVQSSSFLARWHSPESPLDPSLRDKYINLKDETLHAAKQRQQPSIQKLLFDCVNAALVDIAGYESGSCQGAIPCIGANKRISEGRPSSLVDEVWARMNVMFSCEIRCMLDDYDNSLVAARKEVAGNWWIDHLRWEMDDLGKEIEEKLLEELLLEAVVELEGKSVKSLAFHSDFKLVS